MRVFITRLVEKAALKQRPQTASNPFDALIISFNFRAKFSEDIKQIWSGSSNHNIFGVIFTAIAGKLEKVGPTFLKF